jgi:hypothetical protein
MARRKLSTQGRIVAAGLSFGVAGALAGFMAAGDHTAGASGPATPSSSGSVNAPSSGSTSNGAAVPYDDGGSQGTVNNSPQYSPQPQTRTGGS